MNGWTGSRLPNVHGTYVGKRTYETPCGEATGQITQNTAVTRATPHPVPASVVAAFRRKMRPRLTPHRGAGASGAGRSGISGGA